MKLFTAALLLPFFLLGSAQAATDLGCANLFSDRKSSPFTADELTAFAGARKAGFRIQGMQGVVANRPVKVVFFGEVHVNSKAQIDAGKEVRRHFPTRALEGVREENYPYPKIMGMAMEALHDFYDSISRIFKLRGSNLAVAQQENKLQEYRKDLLEQLDQENPDLNGIGEFLDEDGAFDLPSGYKSFVEFVSLKGAAALKEYLNNYKVSETPIITIPLETLEFGEKPSWREKIFAMQFAASALTLFRGGSFLATSYILGCSAAACFGSLHGIPDALTDIGTIGIAYGGLMGPAAIAFRVESNHFMVANLIGGLKQHADRDSVLVMVGMAHIWGMKRILKKKYGFTEIPI